MIASEPEGPSDRQRRETEALALAIIDSVRNDQEMPWPLSDVGHEETPDRQHDLELAALSLAQVLIESLAELRDLRRLS